MYGSFSKAKAKRKTNKIPITKTSTSTPNCKYYGKLTTP
jgi:hypothetical protein